MKQLIRLTESDLHRIIENCVRKTLNELAPQTYQNYANGRWQQSMNKRGYSPALSRKYNNYKQQMQGYKSYFEPNMNNDEYDEYTSQLWRNGLQSQSREGQDMANGWKGDGHGGLEY